MITTNAQLEECIEFCLAQEIVAVDTEFVWEKTYFANLGLIQLCAKDQSFLIDPVALDDLSPLGKLMQSTTTVKVLHDALQDLQIIARATNVTPKNIFDTKLASGFAGDTSSISLAAIIEKYCGVHLAKTESRTDWLKRPLSEKQLEYAVEDVIYMEKPYNDLLAKISELGNLAFFQEEMLDLENPQHYQFDNANEKQFKKAAGSAPFNARQLAVLKELVFWREATALAKNKPRSFIIPQPLVVDLAFKAGKSDFSISDIEELLPYNIRRYTRDITQCIVTAQNLPLDQCPLPYHPSLERKVLKKHADRILNHMRTEAEKMHIDPQCVSSRSEVEKFVNYYFDHQKTIKKCRLNQTWRSLIFNSLSPIIED